MALSRIDEVEPHNFRLEVPLADSSLYFEGFPVLLERAEPGDGTYGPLVARVLDRDHHAVVDVSPRLPSFIQCAGFGGHGIMHSLAAGQAVAELVRDGRSSTFDLHRLRLARFEEGDLTVEQAVL